MTNRDFEAMTWTKSSYSGDDGGDCVEIASGIPGAVPVRDSKDVDGPALVFGAAAFSAFLADVTATS